MGEEMKLEEKKQQTNTGEVREEKLGVGMIMCHCICV